MAGYSRGVKTSRLSFLLLLAACGGGNTVRGVVTDVWGEPLEGVTVRADDLEVFTKGDGSFSLALQPGEHDLHVGLDGYIQDLVEADWVQGEKAPADLRIELYPQPDVGFWLVGAEEYELISPQLVQGKGNDLIAFHGVQTIGEALVEGPDFEVVFHTPLRLDEIHRLGLELHRLDYVPDAETRGILGTEVVPVNLYTSVEEVELELTPMRSRYDYLLTVEGGLAPGAYAFHTQRLLTPRDAESFSRIPEPMRVAFPFELR